MTVEPIALHVDLSLSQAEYCLSKSRYPWLIGPERSGKTFAAIAKFFSFLEEARSYLLIKHDLERCKDPEARKVLLWGDRICQCPHFAMRGAVIRDTHVNLTRHFVKSVERSPFADVCEFKDDHHKLYADGMDFDLYGMDASDSLSKIQGGEYQCIHIEEPAPILHTGNQGMREIVYQTAMRRVAAGGAGPKYCSVGMNPADTKHWTYKYAMGHPYPDNPLSDATYTATRAVFRMSKTENTHVSEEDREARSIAFSNRPDLMKRYDEGEFSDYYEGVAITEEYKQEYHLSKTHLNPIPDQLIIRAYDGGLNPTCVLWQFTPSGRLFFLDCVMLPGSGMHQLIERRLKPLLALPRYAKCRKWYDGGDASLESPEQDDSDHSAARVIEDLLKTTFHPGVQDWGTRREAIKYIFTQSPGGVPMVQVNPTVTEGEPFNRIDAAFNGGYSYPVDAMGQVKKDGPDKKQVHSHVGDAITHVLARLLYRPHEKQTRLSAERQKSRARGYGVGA